MLTVGKWSVFETSWL